MSFSKTCFDGDKNNGFQKQWLILNSILLKWRFFNVFLFFYCSIRANKMIKFARIEQWTEKTGSWAQFFPGYRNFTSRAARKQPLPGRLGSDRPIARTPLVPIHMYAGKKIWYTPCVHATYPPPQARDSRQLFFYWLRYYHESNGNQISWLPLLTKKIR